ncbi:hypothetical protein BDF20DRAFT_832432 [Mycotypha africana]|uniref:uncharacterized protein n=1 Tax=Mycotypha africana TaxID=64632 RepID=UPI0023012475|nr:uncharacterized protein BDF20DRAFT_832432 [Mycotypha africana]KAI8987504.1 hypothetical protein BDF20DRAFT_832432 [Mycotypha africana]
MADPNLLFSPIISSNDIVGLNSLSKSSPSQLPQFQLKRSRAQPIPLPTTTTTTATPSTDYNNSNGKLIVTSPPNGKLSNLSHVPCKFYKQGTCTAGANCTFSHNSDFSSEAAICKYFLKGNCKFGSKCALLHNMSIFHQQSQHQQYQHNGNSNAGRRFLSSSVNSHLYNIGNAATATSNYIRRRQQTTSSSLSDQMMMLSISPPLNSPLHTPLPPLLTPTATTSAAITAAGNNPDQFNHHNNYQDPFFGTSAPPSTTMSSSLFHQQYNPTANSPITNNGMWRQHSSNSYNNIASPPLTAGGLRHVSAVTASTAEAFGTSPLFISGNSNTSHPARHHHSSSLTNNHRVHDYFDDAFNEILLKEEEEEEGLYDSEENVDDIHALNDAMLPSSLNQDVFTPKELQLRMHRQRQQSLSTTTIVTTTTATPTTMTAGNWSGSVPLENTKTWRIPFLMNSKHQQHLYNSNRIDKNNEQLVNSAPAINIPSSSKHNNNNVNGYLLQQPLQQDDLSFSLQDDEVQFFMEDDTVTNNYVTDKDDKDNKSYDLYHKTSNVTNRSTNNNTAFPPLLSLPTSSKKSI